MREAQFRTLFRHFLFRVVEVEDLSSHALGDSTKLMGRFAALLIFFSIPPALQALLSSPAKSPVLRLMNAWHVEHQLIAITMFTVALTAILNWDAAFPSRRDIYVLAPYPVPASTLFWARAASGAAVVGLAALLLNFLPGLAWPVALGAGGTSRIRLPALGMLPADQASRWEVLLRRDLTAALAPHEGVTVGVLQHGESLILAFGAAHRESIYQIGSVSKTFTGLMLAELAANGTVKLDDPVRRHRDVTLVELATHTAGMPLLPPNLPGPESNPALDYTVSSLEHFFDRQFVPRLPPRQVSYSNAGFAVLGQVLAARAGGTYEQILARLVTRPLGLADTVVRLDESQRRRLIPGYMPDGRRLEALDIGALAPAGGIYSTAPDLLRYLEAQVAASAPGIRLSHIPRAAASPGRRIALAWVREDATGDYWHNGAAGGHAAHVRFSPRKGVAIVVLVNEGLSVVSMADLIATYLRQRLAGEPAVSLARVTIPETGGLAAVARMFLAWWITIALAALFTYCCLLFARGLPAILMPRAAAAVQIAALCAVAVVFVVSLPGHPFIDVAGGSGWPGWLPSYWFLGLLQQINGSPALPSMAARAWTATAAALALASAMFLFAYLHLIRRIAERPDVIPVSRRGGIPLPRFGAAFTTAVTQFSIRSLARSRLHRLVISFYMGVGLAFLVLLVRMPDNQDTLQASSIVMLICTLMGTRVSFALPVSLPANWLFRITGTHSARDATRSSRRALCVIALLPNLCGTALACLWSGWPTQQAAGHVALLTGLGVLLVEVRLVRFNRIPFTCAYLPGKSQVHMAILSGLMFLWLLSWSIRYERDLLSNGPWTAALTLVLLCAAVTVAWLTRPSGEEEAPFDDLPSAAVQTLFTDD